MITALTFGALGLVALSVFIIITGTRVFKEHERAVVFRLGRVIGVKEPGLSWVWPIDRIERVSLKSIAIQVPRQPAMTKDGVTVGITLALYIRVVDPVRALTEVDDYEFAAHQAAQTALRGIVSQVELDEVLLNRDKVNQLLQEGIDHFIKPFGIVVWLVEVNDIELSAGMRQAMARDAEAERDRSSQVIKAQGESEAADALNHAAEIMERHPAAMQLRILSAMAEVAGAQNTTVIIPIPVELLRLVDRLGRGGTAHS